MVQKGTYELVSGLTMVVLPKAADQLHMRNTGGIFESMISKCCFGLADYMRGLPFLMHCALFIFFLIYETKSGEEVMSK